MSILDVPESEIIRRLRLDNPWWSSAQPPGVEEANWPRRGFFEPFARLAMPRRVGKTVMLKHLALALLQSGVPGSHVLYASIDTPLYSGRSLAALLTLFAGLHKHQAQAPLWLLLDEIQYLKDWEIHLKDLVDAYPQVRVVASGSAAAALRQKSKESGAGRFTEFMLPPLGFGEYLRFANQSDALLSRLDEPSDLGLSFDCADMAALNQAFVQHLNFGGFPEAAANPAVRADPARYIARDIVDKVLLKDLPSLYGIGNTQELNRFFNTLAYHTGCELGLEDLGKHAGIPRARLLEYLEYLEAAFLIRRVHRVDENAARMKRERTFKLLLPNPSMRSALFGPLHAEEAAMGQLVETAVFNQFQHDTHTSRFMHYARWKEGRSDREIDIVLLHPNTQQPRQLIEVKWSDQPGNDKAALRAAVGYAKRHGLTQLWLTSKAVAQRVRLDDVQVNVVPVALLCCTLERQVLRQPGQQNEQF
jgi:uncharacterized protein